MLRQHFDILSARAQHKRLESSMLPKSNLLNLEFRILNSGRPRLTSYDLLLRTIPKQF